MGARGPKSRDREMVNNGKNVRNCPRNLMEFPIFGQLERVSENMGKTSEKPAKMAKMGRLKWGARL